jgi:hypothetical protein
MAQTQLAFSANKAANDEKMAVQPTLALHSLDAVAALTCGELSLSVSELLGCDYVFLQHPSKTLLTHDRHILPTLNQLIHTLELDPQNKIFIGVHENADGELRFERFNCEWQENQAVHIHRINLCDDEQISFIQMIFNCSSPYIAR